MTWRRVQTVILTLVASLVVCGAAAQAQKKPASTATASTQQVPAEYQAGIAQLRIAKGYLEKAGDRWGGYRVQAIGSIDHAFEALGVSPESTPNEMASGNVDEPTMMNKGIASLQAAKADFDKAGNGWGGRKTNGLAHINQALQQLQEGITWAKQHKTY